MKKIITTLLGCFILAASTFAQIGLYAGAGGGFNSVWILNQNTFGRDDRELNYEKKFGTVFGLRVGNNFTPNLGLSLEANLIQGGQKYTDVFGNDETHVKDIRLNSVQIPLLLRYRGYPFGSGAFFAIGPYVSILNKAEVTYTINNEEVTNYPDGFAPEYAGMAPADDKELFRSNEVGVLGELGIDIQAVEGKLFISPSIRVQYGLTDLNAEAYSVHDTYEPSHTAIGGFNLSLYYYFRPKGSCVRRN
jgi:hypothetical protein